ncbi:MULTISPECIES: hypothetical protein [Streptomyces]|uniref:Uncharacterized protein n=1 Tax=Streptomyces fuscus TaxID=3048495 RepID=A0ABT7IY38_9ACTN|nr:MULTISPECIES: hypothetical protein [Streptomyces]MCM1974794.1 hypothetical protein [Streptomyces sp. G1]MDL2076427.1 hypothetical protein [Streptomyces fuscus]SBT91624.1 hypothetical protein GA0115233_103256 [Streptomyces sp. DI166]
MRSRGVHRWRLLTWLIIAFNLAMLLWLVVALDAAEDEGESCVGDLCTGADPSTSMGTWLVVIVWLTGLSLLAVAWFITHHTERPGRRPRRGWHRPSD